MINFKLNGKQHAVQPGTKLIDAADEVGIVIPRFCYHKQLSVAANCRMCLVEVPSMKKVLPACATIVTEGMEVETESGSTKEAQRAVMEYLLINHPLDCPICDQGGECELQDVSMGFGQAGSRYEETKRAVYNPDIGPLIATEMTRCIQCTRCVRFSQEIAGYQEIGAMGRGEKLEITPYLEEAIDSEVSGNMIDICPVGALTSKPFRYKMRTWELTEKPGISPHDCWGTNIALQFKDNKIQRVVPAVNEKINQVWISDRDRFSYTSLSHPDRLNSPIYKHNKIWHQITWEESFKILRRELQNYKNNNQIAALLSPSSTIEEGLIIKQYLSSMDSDNIDFRVSQQDFNYQQNLQLYPNLGLEIAELDQQDIIILLDCDIEREVPLAAIRVRQALKNKAKCFAAGVDELDSLNLDLSKKITFIFGYNVSSSHNFSEILNKLKNLKNHNNITIAWLTPGANYAGLLLAGAIPNNPEINLYKILAQKLPVYFLYNLEPEYDFTLKNLATAALTQAKFVVSMHSFFDKSGLISETANLVLPIASNLGETSGSYINISGDLQKFKAAVKPYGGSRAGWEIWRDLGDFKYQDLSELSLIAPVKKNPDWLAGINILNKAISYDYEKPISYHPYMQDAFLRRAAPLHARQKK